MIGLKLGGRTASRSYPSLPQDEEQLFSLQQLSEVQPSCCHFFDYGGDFSPHGGSRHEGNREPEGPAGFHDNGNFLLEVMRSGWSGADAGSSGPEFNFLFFLSVNYID